MRSVGLTVVAVVVIAATGAGEARAQYVNPNTGINWNNPVSASIDRSRYWMQQGRIAEANIAAQHEAAAEAARNDRILAAGNEKIRRGQATTRFTTRPFQIDLWMKVWRPKTPADRQREIDECKVQGEIWAREVKARRVDLNDIAETAALAFVLAYEVKSDGDKASAKAYQSLIKQFREYFLNYAYFQGMTEAHKQWHQEGLFLSATNPVRRWQRARSLNDAAELAGAKKEASEFLDVYWKGSIDTLRATPDRFTSLP